MFVVILATVSWKFGLLPLYVRQLSRGKSVAAMMVRDDELKEMEVVFSEQR